MEDVFEPLRQPHGGLDAQAIDVLLECLDALEAAVDAIEEDGDEQLDPTALVARLERARRATPRRRRAAAPPAGRGAGCPRRSPRRRRRPRVCTSASRSPTTSTMPSVRAYMVLAAVAEHGETLLRPPTPDEVDAFAGPSIEAWVATEHEPSRGSQTAAAPSPTSPSDGRRVAERREDAAVERRRARAEAAAAAPAEAAAAAQAPPPRAPQHERADRPRRRRAARPAHAPDGRAGRAPHPRRVARRRRRRRRAWPQAVQDLTRSSQALQAMVMQVRMIPVDAVFLRFPRLVRDLSAKLGKQVDLVLDGQDTELDRTVVDALGDPLVHLVRNALDHGLEPPAERERGRQAGDRRARALRPPRRRQRRHHRARRRPRHRPRHAWPRRPPSAA